MMVDPLSLQIESEVERLGFELVDMERAGSRARPVLRLRIDRPAGEPEMAVTLEDCVRVSRSLEAVLDERPDLAPRYVLEVSSPGVERPLVKKRDFERFAGREVAVHLKHGARPGTSRVEGELIGIEETADGESIRLRTADDEVLSVPREQARKVHLVFRWGERGR
ncbi:MAG: ribosome maturation factor RimP [Gemmatimonas sp.]|nr:ribosome maturation factor RimP [Gemmatimonas sp.]